MFTKRNILPTVAVAALSGVVGCMENLDFSGLGSGWGEGGGGGCSTTCEPPPMVTPYMANILRGDTVRFSACNDYNRCHTPGDTGNVVSEWTIPDSNAAALLGGTSAILVPAATSVLVRGVATGRTTVSVTFSKAGRSYQAPTQALRVADSSAITSIELQMYGLSDTIRVSVTRVVSVQLKDVGRNTFRGEPTEISASGTAIVSLARKTTTLGTTELTIVGLKPGKASITATFQGVTATRTLIVVD